MKARIVLGQTEVPEAIKKLIERVQKILDTTLQQYEEAIARGEKIDIMPHRTLALAIRFAEMSMDLPADRKKERRLNLRNLTVDQLRMFRELLELAEAGDDPPPELPS